MTDTETITSSVEEAVEEIRAKILHTLEVCPYITKGMIQQGIGPGVSPKLWHPVLDELESSGKVKTAEITVSAPSGRALSKTIFHLPQFPYPPIKVADIEE